MNQIATAPVQEAASDPCVTQTVRTFLRELDKGRTPFWELPQPKLQDRVTGLQDTTLMFMSGVRGSQTTIMQDGRTVSLHIMAHPPPGATANPLARWHWHDSPTFAAQ